MTRARSIAAGTAAAIAAAALAACDGGAPVPRGFGSVQLTQLRDPSFAFLGSRGDVVLYSVGTDPVRYLSVDVVTGAAAEHDAMFSDVPAPQYTFAADPNARLRCSWGPGVTGLPQLRIEDRQTGQLTTVDSVALLATRCPTEDDPMLTIWRHNGTGHVSLWTGRYDNLQVAPVDLAILGPVQLTNPGDTVVNVVAGRPAAPEALGIFAIDLATFAITEIVPPTLAGGAWAEGATPTGGTTSTSLIYDQNAYWGGVFMIGDHFGYWRGMDDGGGGRTLFVGPFAAGPARELALFHTAAPDASISFVASVYVRAPDGSYAPTSTLPAWQLWYEVGGSDVVVWNDAGQRLVTCPIEPVQQMGGALSADGTKLGLFPYVGPAASAPSGGSLPTGPLKLVDLTSPTGTSVPCATLVSADVSAAGFSPDGSSLFWLVQPPYPATTSQLWLAEPDGSAPVLVGDDRIEGPPHAPHFVGPSQLEVDINADLVWIDPHDDPVTTHFIVDRVRGGAIERGRWLIIGYDASEQDGNADLGIVNRDNGDKRLISADVTSFFSPDVPSLSSTAILPAQRAADDPLRIVYLVRGRNPSPQDGLWVANINASDIP